MARFGSISYAPMVDSVNRKFARRQDIVGKNINFCMGGGTRTSTYAGVGPISKNYMFFRRFGITVPPTASQLAVQETFKMASKARTFILKDLSQINRVQQMFVQASADRSKLVEGVSAYGQTYRGWVFHVCYARVAHNPEITWDQLKAFPTSFDA